MTPANDHHASIATPGLSQALWMKQEVDRFEASFQRGVQGTPLPVWTWEQLERQLVSLSSGPAMAMATPELISAVRKQSRWLPPEMVLREILCAAFAVMDGDFAPPEPEDS